jgi:hypothetical protein
VEGRQRKMNLAPKGGKHEYLARKKKRIDKMFLGGRGNVEKVLDRPLKVTRRPSSKYSTSMTFHWKNVPTFLRLWVVEGVVRLHGIFPAGDLIVAVVRLLLLQVKVLLKIFVK